MIAVSDLIGRVRDDEVDSFMDTEWFEQIPEPDFDVQPSKVLRRASHRTRVDVGGDHVLGDRCDHRSEDARAGTDIDDRAQLDLLCFDHVRKCFGEGDAGKVPCRVEDASPEMEPLPARLERSTPGCDLAWGEHSDEDSTISRRS